MFNHKVKIPSRKPYNIKGESGYEFNEVCIWAIDCYGLPHDKYIVSFQDSDYLEFCFKDEKDALHFRLAWE